MPDPEDAAAVQALGWTAIPDVEVTIRPSDSSTAPQTLHSDATGVLILTGFPAGSYLVEARRWLTAQELAQLPATEDVVGWVVKAYAVVSPAQGEFTLPVPASRKRGLVISEWAFNQKGGYYFAGYLELYNNADTTLYLDGMILGEGWSLVEDYPNFPCSLLEPVRNDPLGIWTTRFQQFPGNGQDYSVAPGQVIVVATDAIDHRPFIEGGLDLSNADFEFSGPADADNPSAPNLLNSGPFVHPFGHGLTYSALSSIPFIALPLEVSSLARTVPPNHTSEYLRIPHGKLLDVVAIASNYVAGPRLCPQLVNPRFDRRETHARGTRDEREEFEYSVSRQRAPGSGMPILQHTRTSDADFVRTRRSPGTLPP